MSNSIQCPACKEQIDGDSLYCDQCGAQILVCSMCGRPGMGKRCKFDGKELVVPGGAVNTASAVNTTSAASPSVTEQVSHPVTPASTQVSASAAAQSASGDKIKLVSQSHGIVIDAKANDILGRKKGNFTSILEKHQVISGNHCQILKLNGLWSIMDLGSTNGTFVGGQRLNPNSPMPLQNNAAIKIADIEFRVTFEQADNGTSRI